MRLSHPCHQVASVLSRVILLSVFVMAGTGEAGQAEGENPVALSLKDAFAMALHNDLDVVVSRLQTEVQANNLLEASGAYKPSVSMSVGNDNNRQPSTSQLSAAQRVASTASNFDFGWQQLLPGGGSYSFQFHNLRSQTNSPFITFNPSLSSTLGASVTQPLLKDFKLDANRRQVVVSGYNERISHTQLQSQVMDVVDNVENAYWDLVYSLRNLDVAQSSLKLAQDLLHNNQIQVEVGTMSPLDVLQAQAQVATQEEAVIAAEADIQSKQDALSLLVKDPASKDFWSGSFVPTDEPREASVTIDVDSAIETALQQRPELAGYRLQRESSDYDVRYTGNQLKPAVDLTGAVTLYGLGGDEVLRQGFGGQIIEQIPGGYGDALSQLFSGSYRDWSLGLTFSYPLGESAARAAHAAAQVSLRQQNAIVRKNELVIAQQVREAARQVETYQKQISATRVARDLAQQTLDAEQEKFAVGMSTSFLIVQRQNDLTLAQVNYLSALIAYNKALASFERARGTILSRAGVEVR